MRDLSFYWPWEIQKVGFRCVMHQCLKLQVCRRFNHAHNAMLRDRKEVWQVSTESREMRQGVSNVLDNNCIGVCIKHIDIPPGNCPYRLRSI